MLKRVFLAWIVCMLLGFGSVAAMLNSARAGDNYESRIAALEATVTEQGKAIDKLSKRVDAIEGGGKPTKGNSSSSKKSSFQTITLTGEGDNVTESFFLPRGRYKVTGYAEGDNFGGNFIGEAYASSGGEFGDLVINDIVDAGRSLTTSKTLNVSHDDNYYIEVTCSCYAWTITIEALG